MFCVTSDRGAIYTEEHATTLLSFQLRLYLEKERNGTNFRTVVREIVTLVLQLTTYSGAVVAVVVVVEESDDIYECLK